MTHFVTLDRQQVGGTNLAEKIRELDTEIMAPFFADLGQPFPIEKRMLAFAHPGTLVVAQDDGGKLLGYLEYGAGWDRAEECYLNSIQIAPQHRGGWLLLKLLGHAIDHCELPPATVLRTHVQANNARAIRLLEIVGFAIDMKSDHKGTLAASAISPLKWRIGRKLPRRICAEKDAGDG